MSDSAFLGELRLLSFDFPPKGWAPCNGQLLPINTNQALFSLLGTTYGGDGRVNFALPELRGRAPIHMGPVHVQGERFGQEAHTLTTGELPAHNHLVVASTKPGDQVTIGVPAGANNLYRDPSDLVPISPETVALVGGSQSHENRAPYLVLQWCIALQGVFPSQS